jgi:hypothetical protein
MPELRNATLQIAAEGGHEARMVRDVLAGFEDAYNGFLAVDRILEGLIAQRSWRTLVPRRLLRTDPFWVPELSDAPWNVLRERPEAPLFVYSFERLLIARVELASPGFFEFLGSLNPLTFISNELERRHRHRQDREYREREERRRLELENESLQLGILERRIEIARENGATDDVIATLLNQLLERPLRQLSDLDARGVIDGSSSSVKELTAGQPRESE